VFILLGLPLAGVGGLLAVLGARAEKAQAGPAVACEGFLMILGVLAVAQGIRSLITPGKV
jgi:hypothetical protein